MIGSKFNTELKIKKPLVKKRFLQEINKFMNNDIPDSLAKVIDESFENKYPKTRRDLYNMRDNVFRQLKEIREISASESENLDNPCKSCIEKIVNELYDLRPGVGIGHNLGQYMSRIWHFNEVVVSLFSSKDMKFTKFTEIYLLQQFYKTSYEFTIKFLTEFAYEIALEKGKNNDKSSKTFVDRYRYFAEIKGGKPMTHDLIKYLREQKYYVGNCLFLQDSMVRDSICHENVSFDEKTNLLTFGKKKIILNEFVKYFEELYTINQYLISQNLERSAKEIPKIETLT